MIYYFYPNHQIKSAGIRLLYRHVEVLVKNGIAASMLHGQSGFEMPDVPQVPVAFCDTQKLEPADIVVVSEGMPHAIPVFKAMPTRVFAIALSWEYVFNRSPIEQGWADMGVEHVIANSPYVADYVAWSQRLAVSVFRWGINESLYFPTRKKQREVVFMQRKQDRIESLKKLLHSRDPRFVQLIRWTGADGLTEDQYADLVRRSMVFINLSRAEALPCAMLEAMRCHTLVAGYHSIGGKRELIGEGPNQNMILADMLDYPALAAKLEPILLDIIQGNVSRHEPIIQNAFATAQQYTREAEEESIVRMWRQILGLS